VTVRCVRSVIQLLLEIRDACIPVGHLLFQLFDPSLYMLVVLKRLEHLVNRALGSLKRLLENIRQEEVPVHPDHPQIVANRLEFRDLWNRPRSYVNNRRFNAHMNYSLFE
jgi:hypothetical protein